MNPATHMPRLLAAVMIAVIVLILARHSVSAAEHGDIHLERVAPTLAPSLHA